MAAGRAGVAAAVELWAVRGDRQTGSGFPVGVFTMAVLW